jgi:hypothetical protein
MTRTSGIHGVGTAGFKHIDGQEAERTLRVTIAKQRVWNIGPILQGLARPVLSRLVAAIGGLGNPLDDVDRSANGMPMKRRRTPRADRLLQRRQVPDDPPAREDVREPCA